MVAKSKIILFLIHSFRRENTPHFHIFPREEHFMSVPVVNCVVNSFNWLSFNLLPLAFSLAASASP